MYGSQGDDEMEGGLGSDTIHGDQGHDAISGGGGTGDDTIDGDLDDIIVGSYGDDELSEVVVTMKFMVVQVMIPLVVARVIIF